MQKKSFAAPERVVERGRGCYNCVSYDNNQLARQTWRMHRALLEQQIKSRDLIRSTYLPVDAFHEANKLAAQGMPDALAAETAAAKYAPKVDAREERLRQIDKLVMSGAIGLCMCGGAGTDFVSSAHLCAKWSGKQGSSVATGGKAGKLDKLSDELKDIADSKAPKR